MTLPDRGTEKAQLRRETEAMLFYLLKRNASLVLLERGLRAIGDDAPVALPGFALGWPWTIAMLEPIGRPANERQQQLRHRLNILLAVVETSAEGVDRLRLRLTTRPLSAVASLVVALTGDVLIFPVRVFASRLLR
jgi:hypothetical protein